MPAVTKEFSNLTLSSPRRRTVLIAGLILTWSLSFTLLSHDSTPLLRATTESSSPEWLPVKKLSCTDTFWVPEECGIHGESCQLRSNHFTAFQCPANCVRDGIVTGNPHLAGAHDVLGEPLVIGGPIYRGDSYICPTAVHAGVVEDATGGCGVAKFMGMTNSFPGVYGMYGKKSIDVDSYFPLTFRFTLESEDLQCPAPSKDLKWTLPLVSAAHTALVWKTTYSSTIRTVWALAVMYRHLSVRGGAGRLLSSPAEYAPPPADAPIPEILEPLIFRTTISNATFKWATPVPEGVEGISMLVDDVERSRRYFGSGAKKSVLLEGETADSFVWQRTPQAVVDYIRFGFIKGGRVVKYSQAGVWLTNGTWTGIPPEPKA